MDFNTYTYRPGAYETAMPLEIASWACYAKLQEARKAYGLYDVKNDRVLRAYREFAWEHAPEFPDPVHFPTYGRMERRPLHAHPMGCPGMDRGDDRAP